MLNMTTRSSGMVSQLSASNRLTEIQTAIQLLDSPVNMERIPDAKKSKSCSVISYMRTRPGSTVTDVPVGPKAVVRNVVLSFSRMTAALTGDSSSLETQVVSHAQGIQIEYHAVTTRFAHDHGEREREIHVR